MGFSLRIYFGRGSILLLTGLLGLILTPSIAYSKTKVPEWVKNQTADTESVLYGVGGGASVAAAKQVALKDIAGKLLTAVESETRSHTLSSNGSVSERFSQSIKTSVEDITLGGYVLDYSEKKGKTYWVRLSLKKQQLYDTTKAQLDQSLLELNNFFSDFETMSVLYVKRNSERINKIIDKAGRQSFVSKAALDSFDLYSVQSKLAGYEKKLNEKVNGLKISVEGSGELVELARKVADALNREGVLASSGKEIAGVVTVKLSGSFVDSIQVGAKFSAATVVAKVNDEFGRLVSEREYHIHGTSRSSHKLSRQIAVNKFIDQLATNGAWESLGF